MDWSGQEWNRGLELGWSDMEWTEQRRAEQGRIEENLRLKV